MNQSLTRLVAASREVARIIRAEPKMSGRSAYHLRQPSDVGEIMDEFNAALADLDAAQPEGQDMVSVPRGLVEQAYREGFSAGGDHNNLSYKYPPENIAWRFSQARENVTGVRQSLDDMPEWTKPNSYEFRGDEPREIGALTKADHGGAKGGGG